MVGGSCDTMLNQEKGAAFVIPFSDIEETKAMGLGTFLFKKIFYFYLNF